MRARVLRRLDELAQDRRDVLGMDRELERGEAVVGEAVAAGSARREVASGSMTMRSGSTVALAAIAAAMILPWLFRASSLASISQVWN